MLGNPGPRGSGFIGRGLAAHMGPRPGPAVRGGAVSSRSAL